MSGGLALPAVMDIQAVDGLRARLLEARAGSVARFQIGAVAAPARAAAAPRPTNRTVTAMKTVGHGGAARKPQPVAAEDGWEEF